MADLAGFGTPAARANDYGAMGLVLEQFLARVQTATLVVVKSIGSGVLSVQPLVKQINGAGQTQEQPIIPGVPFVRLQGGTNAVIIDPVAGDLGICLFASRDISGVKRARASASPGSLRRHDLSDALYIGGVLNGTPTQYVSFLADGIHIHSPTKIYLEGDIIHTGTLISNSKNIGSTHTHTGVQTGGGTSGPPS